MQTVVVANIPAGSNPLIANEHYRAAVIVNGLYVGRGVGNTPARALDHALTGRCSMNAVWARTWPVPATGKTVTFEVE